MSSSIRVSMEKTYQPANKDGTTKYEPIRFGVEITESQPGEDIQATCATLYDECLKAIQAQATKFGFGPKAKKAKKASEDAQEEE